MLAEDMSIMFLNNYDDGDVLNVSRVRVFSHLCSYNT